MKNYKVTEQSAYFIEALKAFSTSQDLLLRGLYAQYGGEGGNKVFDNLYASRFREAERIYFDALGISVMDMVTNSEDNEI